MTMPQSQPDEQSPAAARLSWDPPTMTLLGKIRDIVHGGEKSEPEDRPVAP